MPDTLVEILPTSLDLLHRKEPSAPTSLARPLLERAVQHAMKSVVVGDDKKNLHFSIVNSPRKWAQIRKLRLETYANALPYMRNVVSREGVDAYDARSVIFGAWHREEPIASVRLTAWPFEMATLLPPATFDSLTPEGERLETLEFSRLISVKQPHFSRVMPALVVYAATCMLLNTGCRRYIGYTKTNVSRLFSKFMCTSDLAPFVIPERGEHTYRILKGEFRRDIHNMLDRQVKPRPLGKALKCLI